MRSKPADKPIRQMVRVDAPIEIVRTFFTDPQRLVEWWPTRATIDPRVGGKVEFEFDRADGNTDRAEGTFIELGRERIVLTWGFERDPDLPPGSRIVLTWGFERDPDLPPG